ncbi:MAG: PAS domain-containing protein, partial [Pseudomonadales bacterium]
MIVIVGDDSSLDDVVKISRQCETQPPVVLVTAQTDEEAIADAMLRGARDVVSMTQTDRLSSVLQRELRSSQLDRSLKVANAAVDDFQRQLHTLIENSPDAMSLVQEGIILQANAAWLELFGFAREDDLIRQPLLDLFLENDHEALKGAVTACQDGKWIDHAVRVAGIGNDDGSLSLDLRFELAEHEGEPAVRIRVAPARVGQKTMRLKLENASS